MLAINVAGQYIQEEGIITKIGDYITQAAKNVLIITSPTAWALTGQAVEQSLGAQGVQYRVEWLNGECTLDTIQLFAGRAQMEGIQAVIGIGGGRVMDTAKGVGELANQLPVINVPTVAATCAACSPSSVLYNEHGARIGLINGTRAPVYVLVDSQIIAQSPPRFLRAGIVDALAKWYEFSPYLERGNGALGLLVKTQAAKLSLESILNYGCQAVDDNRQQRVTTALQNTIAAVISIAGLANSVKDGIPRSGIAHEIHDSMTHHSQFHHWLHGEKVGFALVVQALVQDPILSTHHELLELLTVYQSPVSVEQLGIANEPLLYSQIAARINTPPDVVSRLSFTVNPELIAKAFAATATINTHYGVYTSRIENPLASLHS
ncbi:iron-containing alcohol dehydrogenase family protein [Serratia sp. M24T3]|uniref:iron-containing alcohol dehydrogenase family protein n=1 Tax=Serratia sp. M24T3 TaxID=932213 RepID=UPI00025BB67E|nr:iron-containing alcohol dehydrogenase family protein [Serratia sp. M24T3]EIC83091.1 iron-containing alcohol dehydrogenase [Serratia sp. M24T3]